MANITGDQIRTAYAYNVRRRAVLAGSKTQRALALTIGVSRGSIAAVYNYNRFVDPEVLALLANYFACAPHELFDIPPELL